MAPKFYRLIYTDLEQTELDLVEDKDGNLVYVADYAALEASNAALRAALERLCWDAAQRAHPDWDDKFWDEARALLGKADE